MNEPKQEEFIDGESDYQRDKDKISFKIIVLGLLKRITELGSVEWHGGYTQKKSKPIGDGMSIIESTYIQNSRECFGNAVFCLYDLCSPYFDKEIKKFDEDFNRRFEKKKKSFFKQGKYLPDWDDEKTLLVRELLRALGSFLKRKGYFKGREITD